MLFYDYADRNKKTIPKTNNYGLYIFANITNRFNYASLLLTCCLKEAAACMPHEDYDRSK